MKKTLIVLISMLVIVSMFGCENKAQIPNPFVVVESIEEAEKITGFDFILPSEINDMNISLIQVMNGKMIEVRYGDNNICLRKINEPTEDISGDYNTYKQVTTVEFDGFTVTLKGNNDQISVATFTNNGYSYAITISELEMNSDAVTAIISSIS